MAGVGVRVLAPVFCARRRVPPGGVSSAAGGASAGSRARFWRFGRIVRAGAPDALSGFRMIPRFLWGRCGAGDGTILPGRQNRARRPPRRDAGRGGTAEPTPPGAADDEDHGADPAPELKARWKAYSFSIEDRKSVV